MILILSRESAETITEAVIDWLKYYNLPYYRFNGEDLFNGSTSVNFFLNKKKNKWSFIIDDGDKKIKDSQISAVWFRRAFDYTSKNRLKVKTKELEEVLTFEQLNQYHYKEASNIFKLFEKTLKDIFWLNKPSDITDKLEVLERASFCGLNVPETIITNYKRNLSDFLKKTGKIITKSTTEGTGFKLEDEYIPGLTASVNLKTFQECKHEIFFPSLFQKQIEKKYELRVFYICGEFFSVAIFSQKNSETTVDYRNYDHNFPNRVDPIILPKEIESKLSKLMALLNLNCGSVDLIKSNDGQYFFLEVNPVGQFLSLSEDGNFNLAKKVAFVLKDKSSNQ